MTINRLFMGASIIDVSETWSFDRSIINRNADCISIINQVIG